MKYPATELVLDSLGQVYHLGISPDQLADKVILVGDQDRVSMVSEMFDTIEHQSRHREFVCHTGTFKGKRISAISTGIGTDNIDITINELDALANIDLIERNDLSRFLKLTLIRIGTCGILQPDVPLNSYILSSHAFGLDNIVHFYEVPQSEVEKSLKEAIESQLTLPDAIKPYLISASQELNDRLRSEQTFEGVTVTSSGFYGPQGRQLRLRAKTALLNEQLTAVKLEGLKVMNFEMESSALFALGRSLGHDCATICLGIGNRPKLEFSKGYSAEMTDLIRYVLDRI
ncbi:MAG: nucleoside phosphorylase [Flavobacteriia bacterium]|jgi:uridine phosphorylase|nr:nucleoside phosphorylase [Cryomorphaceae bacterium]